MPRQAADQNFESVAAIELLRTVAAEHVAHAGRDAHVDDGGDSLLPGEFREMEIALGHEGDVDVVSADVKDGLEGIESEPTGQGADDQVCLGHHACNVVGIRKIRFYGVDLLARSLDAILQRRRAGICHGDFDPATGCEVAGDDGANKAAAKHHDFRTGGGLTSRLLRCGHDSSLLADCLRGRVAPFRNQMRFSGDGRATSSR